MIYLLEKGLVDQWKKGFSVESSPTFKDSIIMVKENEFDFAIVDMRLEDGSGLELVKEIQKISPKTKSLLPNWLWKHCYCSRCYKIRGYRLFA